MDAVNGSGPRVPEATTRAITDAAADEALGPLAKTMLAHDPLRPLGDPRWQGVYEACDRVDEEVGRAMARRRGGEVDE